MNCPLDCQYLREARKHEKLPEIDPAQLPNSDLQIDESFLERHEALLILIASALGKAALETSGAVDRDVREALDSLVRTYRTLQSGLLYDAKPDNPIAARIHTAVQERLQEISERLGAHNETLRDADVLGVIAFLQRMELQTSNGRPKGRAFIDFLTGFLAPQGLREEPGAAGSGLIVTP